MGRTGLIFDMDGVIVDNDRFHFLSWQEFSRNYGFNPDFDEVKSWFGNVNAEILRRVFGKELSDAEIKAYADEKEMIYRDIYKNEICEVPGLSDFLASLDPDKVSLALATSAPPENVDFVLERTGLKNFFPVITDDSGIKNGKPDPEIFLITSGKMGIPPSSCVVFEDSFHGISAARRAGMHVIGVATTHEMEDLKDTDLNIPDFRSVSFNDIERITGNHTS